ACRPSAGRPRRTPPPRACPADAAERRELAAAKPLPQACQPHTRLNVLLPDLPDLGTWRLESHGYYAAVELADTVEFLSYVTGAGRLVPARLKIEQSTRKRDRKSVREGKKVESG